VRRFGWPATPTMSKGPNASHSLAARFWLIAAVGATGTICLTLFLPKFQAQDVSKTVSQLQQSGMSTGGVHAPVKDSLSRPITAGGFVDGAPIVFEDITQVAGVDKFRYKSGTPEKSTILETPGSGVALLDYDNDGWLDIYLLNGSTFRALQGREAPPRAMLFHNNHDGTFTDVTDKAGVANERWGFGVAVADYDNDGWPDIYVSNYGKNRLYHNNHDGTFTDVAEKAGVALGTWSTGATWGDYDHDGFLDLFVPGYVKFDPDNPPIAGKGSLPPGFCQFRGVPVMCGPRGLPGESDHLFHNNGDGTFGAYVARPKTLPASAVVVFQELFGVNADIRKTCDELAEQGFFAVAPDLFWRQEPGVDLSVTSENDWQHGLRLYQAYDRDAGVRDVKDTVNVVAKLPECTGKVAILGYCLGALMVYLTAVRCDVDAAVAYHAGGTEKYLKEVDGLHAPLLMHLGEEDEFIPKAAQADIKAALSRKPQATVYSYPGQRHAFSRHGGTHYDAAAASARKSIAWPHDQSYSCRLSISASC
jgi:dienelactone hydrolase